jgi:hypothetical protein
MNFSQAQTSLRRRARWKLETLHAAGYALVIFAALALGLGACATAPTVTAPAPQQEAAPPSAVNPSAIHAAAVAMENARSPADVRAALHPLAFVDLDDLAGDDFEVFRAALDNSPPPTHTPGDEALSFKMPATTDIMVVMLLQGRPFMAIRLERPTYDGYKAGRIITPS